MAWKILKAEQNLVQEYIEKLNINEIMANVLINRNVDIDTANILFNSPYDAIQDPALLINAEQAALEIIEAVQNDSEIWVFADYDVDGITSGYTITDFLRTTTNNNVYVYYPDRVDGYGLNMDFCNTMIKRKEEENIENMMVITVDNGTSCFKEIQTLKENGIQVVVTDHHQPKDTLPECTVVNPHITEDPVYHHLSGCAVAYKVIQMIERIIQTPNDYTSKYLYAVALGTIADMMPMTPENIAFVRLGLEQINGRNCPKAIKLFKDYIGKKEINPHDIGWDIAPRLNACGRMGDIDKGAMLLYMDSEDDKASILDVIIEIEEINEARKSLTKEAMEDLSAQDYTNDYVCIFDASKYPSGIAGVIAAKMIERYNKVSLVVSGNKKILTGSARSPEGIDLQPLFENEVKKGNLLTFGGHENAAGFSLYTNKLEDLRNSLNEQLEILYHEWLESLEELPEEELIIDCEISLDDLNKINYDSIQSLPYDRAYFTLPTFAITNLQVINVRSSRNNENNICLTLRDSKGKEMSIWAWKMGEYYKEIGQPTMIDIAGRIEPNFMNKREYTLNIVDIKASESNELNNAV